jgi:DNA polymerase III epsilon subunit-like protein
MRVLVFDTETTGLPTERNASIYHVDKWPYIIQLSYIIYCTETNKMNIINDYINIPDSVKISKESQEIHKISRNTLKGGIDIENALKKFNYYSNNSELVVGHNVSFDKRMLMVEGIRNKIRVDISESYCTMKNSIELCKIEKVGKDGEKYYKYPTLSELYEKLFNIIPKNTHDAFIDNLICMRCFCKMELKKDISETNEKIRDLLKNVN